MRLDPCGEESDGPTAARTDDGSLPGDRTGAASLVYQRGDRIGDYVVENKIGEGAVAVVFRVRHHDRGTIHALKLLCASDRGARERLLREGQAQARLVHPNIVRVTEIVRVDEGLGLVMEYVSGPTLEAWLARTPPDPAVSLELFAGIVRAVALVHREELVHRDLKPANILLAHTDAGVIPKLTDFGLLRALDPGEGSRRLTLTGAFLGSPSYMAPEQVRDPRDADQRADLWSLGTVLYELVTRRRAFTGADPLEIANRVVDGRYTPAERLVPGLPKPVLHALHGLFQVDRDRRIASCEELWEILYGDEPGELRAEAGFAPIELEPPSVVGETFVLSRSVVLARSALGPLSPRRVPPHLVLLLAAVALLALAAWWGVG